MESTPQVPFAETLLVRDSCVCLHTQRAARALARRFDEAFQPLGLTNGQFSLLMSLNRPERASLGSVAALLGMDRTTLTAMLKVLERRGLVQVVPDEKDRRTRRISLTERGDAALAAAMPIWHSTHRSVESALGSTADGLRRALGSLA